MDRRCNRVRRKGNGLVGPDASAYVGLQRTAAKSCFDRRHHDVLAAVFVPATSEILLVDDLDSAVRWTQLSGP